MFATFSLVCAKPALALPPTATSLTFSRVTVAPGEAATLVATVTDLSGNAVFPGTVTFLDGARVLGSAQIVTGAGGKFARGTATLSTASFDFGANSITAMFAGTKTSASSKSKPQTLTVSGKYKTKTNLAVSGSSGHFDLTATIQAFGTPVPTDRVVFENDTTGGTLGILGVAGTEWTRGFAFGNEAREYGDVTGGMATGDFNGDGYLDLAVPNYYDYYALEVLLGNGDGTFQPQFAVDTDFPQGAYTGDLNNDGNLDLVTPDFGSGVGVILGNGDGTFQPVVRYNPGGYGAIDAGVADFDRDGNLDIVLINYYTDNVSILLGNGDGTFKSPTFFEMGRNASTLVVGDLNGDGIPDLVVNTKHGRDVLLGKGDGTFELPVTTSLGDGPYLSLVDLNGDGSLDAVITNKNNGTVSISLGAGNGSFKPAVAYPTGAAPGRASVLDVNQDGKLDIAVASHYEGTVNVLLGNGDGTFQPLASYYTADSPPTDLIAGDFNGDGVPDLVASTDEYEDTVLLNELSGRVDFPGVDLYGNGLESVFASYTGDGNYASSSSCDIAAGESPQYPKISGLYASHITSTSVAIGWTTDFPTNGYVNLYTNVNTPEQMRQSSAWQHDATTFHYTVLKNLTPGTVYAFQAVAVSYFSGCEHFTNYSGLPSFTTPAQ